MAEESVRPLIVDPMCDMYVEADDEDDPSGFSLIVKSYGEDGNGVTMMFTSSAEAEEQETLFKKGKLMMLYAEEHGLDALIEQMGSGDEEQSELYVDDIINPPDNND